MRYLYFKISFIFNMNSRIIINEYSCLVFNEYFEFLLGRMHILQLIVDKKNLPIVIQ